MRIRGAGRIARATAEALIIAAKSYNGDLEGFARYMEEVSKILLSTRPTAVSLPNAISYVMKAVRRRYGSVVEAVVRAAMEFKEYSEKALELIGEIGSRMIEDGTTIITHCNSSAVVSILAKAWGKGKRFKMVARACCTGFSLSHFISVSGSLGATSMGTTGPALRGTRYSLPPMVAMEPSSERENRLRHATYWALKVKHNN